MEGRHNAFGYANKSDVSLVRCFFLCWYAKEWRTGTFFEADALHEYCKFIIRKKYVFDLLLLLQQFHNMKQ
jgi:hypothetical protein